VDETKRLLKLRDSNFFANLDCQDSPDKLAETINFFVSVSAQLPEVVPNILANSQTNILINSLLNRQ